MAPLLAAHDSRGLHRTPRCSRASTRCTRGAHELGLDAEQRACSSASTSTSCAPARGSAPPRRRATRRSMQRLAELTTRFGQNVLADETELPARAARTKPTSPACPDFVRAAARQAARERGIADGARDHAVALADRAVPHLLRAARPARAGLARVDVARRARRRARQPRRRRARSSRCATSRRACTATPATPTTRSPTRWRGTPAAVTALLEQVWRAGAARAPQDEREALAALALLARRERRRSSPGTGATTPRRCARCATTSTRREVKPYFPLERMVAAAFDCAARLFGISLRRARRHRRLPPRRRASTRCAAPTARRRPLPARQLRAADQAQRRLDERVPRCSRGTAARRRAGAADHRQQQQLREGRARRADAAQLRRRAHAVPRVRPRPARAAVERHLRAALGHQRAARFRRAAVAAVRALARASPRC